MKLSTLQIRNDIEIPYGYDLLNSKDIGVIESIIKLNPHLGPGGAAQFTTRSEIVIDEIFDSILQRNLNISEIQNLITNATP